MTLLWQIGFQFIFLAIIFGITDYHHNLFHDNKKIGPSFHFLWGCVYFIPAIFVGWDVYNDWKVILLFAAERFVIYNPMLNLMRKKPFFYLSANSNGSSSLWDRIELKWKGAYPYVWAASIVGWVVLQFFV